MFRRMWLDLRIERCSDVQVLHAYQTKGGIGVKLNNCKL